MNEEVVRYETREEEGEMGERLKERGRDRRERDRDRERNRGSERERETGWTKGQGER
jgi:hypothetical protein